MAKNRLTLSFVFFLGSVSFLAGAGFSSFFELPGVFLSEVFATALFFLVFAILKEKKEIFALGVWLLFFALGLLRTDLYLAHHPFQENFSHHSEFFKNVKNSLREKIYNEFPPPHSFLVASLTLGEKFKIPNAFKEKLSLSGLRHIVAISGMHLVILAGIFVSFLITVGVHRYWAIWVTLGIIWLFVLFVGFPPSAVRAGVMSSVFLIGQVLGRQSSSFRALWMTGAGMVFLKPSILRGSISFQLSFLATLGIICSASFFERVFAKVAILKKIGISSLLGLTLGALIFTLPVISFHFNKIYLISPISNLLVVPFLPYLMIGSLLFLLFSYFLPWLAFFVSLLLWPALAFVVFVIEKAGSVNFLVIHAKISTALFCAYYALLFAIFYFFKKRSELKF